MWPGSRPWARPSWAKVYSPTTASAWPEHLESQSPQLRPWLLCEFFWNMEGALDEEDDFWMTFQSVHTILGLVHKCSRRKLIETSSPMFNGLVICLLPSMSNSWKHKQSHLGTTCNAIEIKNTTWGLPMPAKCYCCHKLERKLGKAMTSPMHLDWEAKGLPYYYYNKDYFFPFGKASHRQCGLTATPCASTLTDEWLDVDTAWCVFAENRYVPFHLPKLSFT